ncbi:uncharacterized protein LACBIDRAFT_335984 [Laccaria bicolor S238N-H82]|uniref:Predicted protein n=1 Tax=Laccaria bicolor (strain S238N-H82 / ATCC MYA-4686) TaxID=486041 RepID=B0E420_LACBS|nr:uncharacterized protein LACBIDRAFT_335984 [Laccaria bicolor S238N-H82]EDQ98412.1 predicted protein [Laccaria bicolor S238N-H82]|eukprot:XP_001890938.1 predicted protein [Laccaria bicolor S238N-H82]
MEMVTEALQFWYERQEQHKVAFRFKSFLEGKMLLEAPPRRKIKVHVPKPHVHSVGKGKKPGRSKGQRRGRAATESPSDEEARPKRKEGVEDRQFDDNSWKDLDVDKPAKKRTEQFSKDDWTPDRDGSDDDGEDLDMEKPTKKPTKQHDEHREDGSDDSDSDSDNGQERPKQDTLTEPTVKPSRVNPTLEEDRDSGSDLGSDDATITVDTSPELQPRYNDTRAHSHEVPSDTEVLADDTFWEADLGCGVELADQAKKRKFTDEEDTPCKFPRLEKGYKLGPRSARPGKVKCRAASAVIQATVKPAQATNLRSDTTKASNSFDFTKSSGVNAKRPVPSKQKESEAGPSQQPSIDVPTKPKPKPRPIMKGKVSTGELGIVTRERSKKIAEESVRSTRSKKVSFVS